MLLMAKRSRDQNKLRGGEWALQIVEGNMAKGVDTGRVENGAINMIKHISKHRSAFVLRGMFRHLSNFLYYAEN